MTVTKIEEIAKKGGHSSGPSDSEITRTWRVWTDSAFDTPLTIQPSMPVDYGITLTGHPELVCQAVSYSMEEKGPSLSVWEATYTFKSKKIDEEELERKQFPDPLDRRTRVSMRHVRYGELTLKDRNGQVMITSAGEISPPIEKDSTRYSLHFQKNVSTVPEWLFSLQDKINDSSVLVRGYNFSAGKLKFTMEELPEKRVENGTKYFSISWILDFRREGWEVKRLDAGFYYIDDSNVYRHIQDENGEDVVIEQLLNGSGKVLRETLGRTPQSGEEKYNTFDLYEEGDFTVMPLDEVQSGDA